MPDEAMSHPSRIIRELPELTPETNTREFLYHASRQAHRQYDDYDLIVDIDAHLQEGRFWHEILPFVENDVLRDLATQQLKAGVNNPLINTAPGMAFQGMGGRIPHEGGRREAVSASTRPGAAFVEIMQRSMDAMGVDYQVIFPTAMLNLGLHPMEDVEIHLAGAYCRWLVEYIFPQDPRFIALVYLPFNNPYECEKIVAQYGGHPQMVGFTICATRNKPVHHNQYMRLYAQIQETGKPLVFHSGISWNDPSFAQLNRFISMHALSFVHYLLIHMTNWVINALPERFPKLNTVWVEAGLAWVPFLMQRLDHEVLMRQSEAPGLKRLPSEYMQDMYYSCQPMERTNMKLLQATFEAIKADTQLLYASDWPHWDFDPPSTITSLPFLSDQAKRNILGLNAARVFNIPVKRMRPSAAQVMAEH